MILWSWITLCLRAFVATIFIAYAIGKMRRPSNFSAIIRGYRIIPDRMSDGVARVLPVVELGLGLLFLLNIFPFPVSIALGILLLLFSALLLRARFSPQINQRNCGCSGARNGRHTIGIALFRNTLLLSSVIVVVIAITAHKSFIPSPLPFIEPALLLCILAGVVCTQTQFLSSLLHTPKFEAIQTRGEDTSPSTTKSNRRSFIKWGVQLGIAALIGVGGLWSSASKTFAVGAGSCPPGESCDCGPSGHGGWSGDCETTFDCTGNIGRYVPVTKFCIVYCCGSNPQGCEFYRYLLGYHFCTGKDGC